jgi:hypothetical protein
MLLARGLLGFALLALWIYCIVDVITRDRSECRNLPKPVWLMIVVFLPAIGSLLWLVAGRPRTSDQRDLPYKGNGRFPGYDRPGRRPATNPDDDEDFLHGLRERAERQRRAADQQRREAERRAAEDQKRRELDE